MQNLLLSHTLISPPFSPLFQLLLGIPLSLYTSPEPNLFPLATILQNPKNLDEPKEPSAVELIGLRVHLEKLICYTQHYFDWSPKGPTQKMAAVDLFPRNRWSDDCWSYRWAGEFSRESMFLLDWTHRINNKRDKKCSELKRGSCQAGKDN